MNSACFENFIIISAWVAIVMVFYGTMTDVGFVYSLYFKLSPFLMHTDMRSFARFEHILLASERSSVSHILAVLFTLPAPFFWPLSLLSICKLGLRTAMVRSLMHVKR